MAEIKSNEVQLNTKADLVQEFLSDLNNLEQLMPEDKVQNWQSDYTTCSFTIKGLASIGMKREESSTPHQVHLVSHGKNPFDFTLNININNKNESCSAQIIFDGNMNFMIMTMAKGPLENLFNKMGETLAEKFS